ncbi:MAG TPA: FAD-binding protein [Streptosporangiaceae bacterium]|nr:FAD-binding protein [Streptosporangiaceae bacterium]
MAGERNWDLEADVVVIGFGAAGACAALEAVAGGADVLVIDRFGGGGATELSGGIVYAGGGTIQQLAANVTDTPEEMLAYLRCEVGDAVSEETLAKFCVGSADLLAWLVGHGVPFQGSLCPEKTSYPTNRHYLYYSGSELSFAGVATPAPRGHRALGRGTSGKVLYDALDLAVRASGARVVPQTRAVSLVTDADGRVVGVECQSLRGASAWARFRHRMLHESGKKPFLYAGGLGRRLHKPVARIEARRARPLRIGARRGVVIAAGGFVANRAMLREHAPAYRGGLALGTVADDGSGITLGIEAGGATKFLDHVSCWRFITPPTAFLRGIIVDSAGQRICDESRYGAAIGDALVNHDRRGWLLADQPIIDASRRKLRSSTLWFQLLQALYLLNRARVSAVTVEEAAGMAGIDQAGLAATVAAYNENAANGTPDPLGKPADLIAELKTPPYSLIDLSIRPRPAYPAPMLTLGGLVVEESTGLVRRADGSVIEGLYAAGRSAVGLCSNSYVSGLSLADCVFSGRRAGRHAASA